MLGIGPIKASFVLKPVGAPQLNGEAEKKVSNSEKSALRIAQPEEEEDLMQFCRELWEENGKEFFSFDEEKIRHDLLRRSFERRNGMMAVIGEPGKIEAGALLVIDPQHYTSDFALYEMFSYVRPQFRQSQHAKTLVAWAMKMSERLRLPLFIGILSNHRTVAKVRLYRRFLGNPSGAYFVYKPKSLYSATGNGPVTGSASTSH